MEPFRYHVYICDQQKPDGAPCCSARGSGKTIDLLRREIGARGLVNDVQVTVCGSLGLCERGPNMVVYPEGIWYSGVTAEEVPEIVASHFQNGQPIERLVNRDASALGVEIRTNRDKMLMALRAKDAAGVLPDDLVQTIRGFMESRVVLTALELDVFTAAGEGETAGSVASRIGTEPRATETLLNALAAMGLMTKKDGLFATTPVTRRFFTAGSKDDARLATLHTASLWKKWSTLTECVKAGTSVTYQEMHERGDDWTRPFIAAMHRNATERARLAVQAVGIAGIHRMLDVGGGSGAYSIAFAQASAQIEADILDVEPVLPLAQEYISAAGVEERVKTRAGDLRTDDFGSGYDLVFVSAICHMLGPSENADLLRRCHRALGPGGQVVIQDFILDEDKTSPKQAALFSINMLVGTKGGASYSGKEYEDWLASAGFTNIRRVKLPGPTHLMVGVKTGECRVSP